MLVSDEHNSKVALVHSGAGIPPDSHRAKVRYKESMAGIYGKNGRSVNPKNLFKYNLAGERSRKSTEEMERDIFKVTRI